MVPNSRGNSGHGLPWVGIHLKGAAGQGQQVGMSKEASGDLMCKTKREAGNPRWLCGTSFLKFFLIYLKLLLVELFGTKVWKTPSKDVTK